MQHIVGPVQFSTTNKLLTSRKKDFSILFRINVCMSVKEGYKPFRILGNKSTYFTKPRIVRVERTICFYIIPLLNEYSSWWSWDVAYNIILYWMKHLESNKLHPEKYIVLFQMRKLMYKRYYINYYYHSCGSNNIIYDIPLSYYYVFCNNSTRF